MKKITALIMALVMASLTFIVPVAAADRNLIADPDTKEFYLNFFNEKVNEIKSVMPYCTMVTSYTLNDPTVGSLEGEVLDEQAQKWIKWIIDSCFKSGSGLANKLFTTIFGDNSAPESYTFLYGEKRDNRVPVSGKSYVSALTPASDFYMLRETTGGTKLHPENAKTCTKLVFYDTKYENVKDASISKIMNLTSANFNPILVSDAIVGENNPSGENALEGVKFEDFEYSNAYAEIVTDANDELLEFRTNVDYTFTLSLYDFIRLISAIAGFDFAGVAIAIANTILTNTGKESVTPEDILKQRCLYITYNVKMEMGNFVWAARYFGDIDNDLKVASADARAALRHAVGTQTIRNQSSLIYGDVDFDGIITAADARLILRMSVGLEKRFSTVPEGKEILIVEVQDEPLPDNQKPLPNTDPDNPTDIVLPDIPGEDGGNTGSGMIDISDTVTDFTQLIFDIINAIKDVEGAGQDAIQDITGFLY